MPTASRRRLVGMLLRVLVRDDVLASWTRGGPEEGQGRRVRGLAEGGADTIDRACEQAVWIGDGVQWSGRKTKQEGERSDEREATGESFVVAAGKGSVSSRRREGDGQGAVGVGSLLDRPRAPACSDLRRLPAETPPWTTASAEGRGRPPAGFSPHLKQLPSHRHSSRPAAHAS